MIPIDFYKLQKLVIITADVMFVNGTALLVTSEIKFKLATLKHIPRRTADQLSKISNKVIKLYGRGYFFICVILVDIDFKTASDKLGEG